MEKLFLSLNIVLVIVTTIVLNVSCGNENPPVKENSVANIVAPEPVIVFDSLDTGIVIDSLTGRNNKSVNFALYLPSAYTTEKQWPVCFLYDSHARGAMSTEFFREAAEKHGYIVIASNSSKNGIPLDISYSISEELIDECLTRFSIDKKRIYTAGFSGGARVASYTAITRSDIAGVICMSGGLPSNQKITRTEFEFAGITGTSDFNFFELSTLDTVLDEFKVRNQLYTFEGGHEYPDKETIDEALLWLDLNAVRKGKLAADSVLIEKEYNSYISKTEKLVKGGQFLKAQIGYHKILNLFEGIYALDNVKEDLSRLESDTKFQNQLKAYRQILADERSTQKNYFEKFISESEEWWKSEIQGLQNQIKKEGNPDKAAALNRIKNYISMLAYTHSDNALSSGQIGHAGKFLTIYYTADPQNADCSYLWACFHALKGDTSNSTGVLDIAIKLGFNDWQKLEEDTRLDAIRNTQAYRTLISGR